MEASLEKYKRRLEEMEDLRQQNKELDDLNTKYLDQVKHFRRQSNLFIEYRLREWNMLLSSRDIYIVRVV